MNKLEGFFCLKKLNIPTIPWKEYTGKETFSQEYLWTVRTAVLRGNDLNLPRIIGVNSIEAEKFAQKVFKQFKNKGMIIYYPYFTANKSGTLEVSNNYILIEAVEKDLWNLVTKGKPEMSIQWIHDKENLLYGKKDFLSNKEMKEILNYVPAIKKGCRNILSKGHNLLLEWSFACYKEEGNNGDDNLIFYEIREINTIIK